MSAVAAGIRVRGGPPPGRFAWLLDTITRVRLGDVLTVSALALLWSALQLATKAEAMHQTMVWTPAFNNVLSYQLNAIATLYAVSIADRASLGHERAWWVVPCAVLAAVAFGSSAMWVLSQGLFGWQTAHAPAGTAEPFLRFMPRHALGALAACGLGTLFHEVRRGVRQRRRALARLQRDVAQLERRLVASRFAAMQARVDPAFIAATLRRLEATYAVDRPAAERLLRSFVAFLRSAVPRSVDEPSTLRREVATARAWWQVAASPEEQRRVLRVSAMPRADVVVPAPSLFPLIRHALERSLARADTQVVDVEARVAGDRVHVTVRTGFAVFDAPDAEGVVAVVRAALAAGPRRAALAVAADGREVRLDLPRDAGLRIDRRVR